MWQRISRIFLGLILCLLPLASQPAKAELASIAAPVVINELQLNGQGTGTTGQEFIELKNTSIEPVDISGWKLQYISSTGNLSTAKYFVTFPADTVIYADGSLLITPETYLPDVLPKITYAITSSFAGLASTGGTVVLVNNLAIAVDTVGWGTKATIVCETELATAPIDGESIQRIIADGKTVDTNNNKNDFEPLIAPTPETTNVAPVVDPPVNPDPEPPVIDPTPIPVPDPSPTPDPVPDPVIDPIVVPDTVPIVVSPQLPVLINELLIDPASPLTDANDEWVELYNPNDTAQDLAGYVVYAGETYSYKHMFAAGTIIPAGGYIVITSADTSIALANGGGAVKIVGPNGQTYDVVTYDAAKSNQAWAKDQTGVWQWTTMPTQGGQNNITAPTVAEKIVATAAAKKVTTKLAAATTAKTTSPKVAAAKTTKAKGATDTTNEPVLVPAPTPLPIPLLATLCILAVLYSTYEYRFDIANKFYQLRNYRTTR